MTVKEFIREFLSKNEIENFKNALYEYHDYSETHFLKLIPESIVEEDENQLILSNLIIAFEEMFQGEMLCIIGDNSLTKLENPIALFEQKLQVVKIQSEPLIFTPDVLTMYTLGLGINYFHLNINPPLANNFLIQDWNWNNVSYPLYYLENFDINIPLAAEPEIPYGIKEEEIKQETTLPLAA